MDALQVWQVDRSDGKLRPRLRYEGGAVHFLHGTAAGALRSQGLVGLAARGGEVRHVADAAADRQAWLPIDVGLGIRSGTREGRSATSILAAPLSVFPFTAAAVANAPGPGTPAKARPGAGKVSVGVLHGLRYSAEYPGVWSEEGRGKAFSSGEVEAFEAAAQWLSSLLYHRMVEGASFTPEFAPVGIPHGSFSIQPVEASINVSHVPLTLYQDVQRGRHTLVNVEAQVWRSHCGPIAAERYSPSRAAVVQGRSPFPSQLSTNPRGSLGPPRALQVTWQEDGLQALSFPDCFATPNTHLVFKVFEATSASDEGDSSVYSFDHDAPSEPNRVLGWASVPLCRESEAGVAMLDGRARIPLYAADAYSGALGTKQSKFSPLYAPRC